MGWYNQSYFVKNPAVRFTNAFEVSESLRPADEMIRGIYKTITGIFRGPRAASLSISGKTEEFRTRYKAFRSLLTTNNNALDLMTEMEQTQASGRPFGMTYVRSHCTALTVNVYKMVKALIDISDGRYPKLEPAFNAISSELEAVLSSHPQVAQGKFVLDISEIDAGDDDLVGNKMANLGEIRNRLGLEVPDGFVITAPATYRFIQSNRLTDEINRRLTAIDPDDLESLYTASASIQQLITWAPIPRELGGLIMEHHQKLLRKYGSDVLISMRSSAVGEDVNNSSFAGQYRTQLNVGGEFLEQTYKEIVASKYRGQAISYRLQRGFRHQDVIMCVGCLVMVDAAVSGVMFSRPPRNPDSAWVEISAAQGLANRVVEGSIKTDYYAVEHAGNMKISKISADGSTSFVLSDVQTMELANIAIRLENHFGAPQDIEWSIDREGRIVILQSRPLAISTTPETPVYEDKEPGDGDSILLKGGLSVSKGAASGQVHIARTNIEMLEVPKGAVLVITHPWPEWAALLSRVSAVISESGHAATHLAIVAREFGVPALFGLTDAARKLENGMLVTVDATGCRVFKGRNEDALSYAIPHPDLMTGSPVHRILKEAMKIILPLNLTDPGSPFFKPSHCRTFHDLTRFCHEKAVAVMFAFGSNIGFDEKSAKQLVGETPYRWWIINLDDGFREGYDTHSKFVCMEDIDSPPMEAIWGGMTSKPWAGPPPVNLKGFGSILFRSTMNPSLDPAVRSAMAAKNYFLISRNFCNLSMRLGYHFALVEAYLGEMLTENYVSFQFKGGAADKERRFIRVQLIRDLLEQLGFRVELRLDALSARIEKMPSEYLQKRLKGLGYLLIHTRQIDMAMGERAMVEYYRETIKEDLRNLFGLMLGKK